jgi:hypothetical protein
LAQTIATKQGRQDFLRFDTTDIKGELTYLLIRHKGVEFKIKGDEDSFTFYPYTGELNEFNIFDHIAKKGNIIIKPIHADTLRLIKNGKVYRYTFQKF